ncbi:MAG: sulfatase-like hydrolase/transferase [Thermoguttaceae bacterium]
MNAVCLVIDRLHAGYVGAYGNTWIETPALDRLASESLVLDQAIIDSPDLERLYRSCWQGWHALGRQSPPASRPSLAALLRESGVATTLLTDDPQVARHPLAADFAELVEIDPPWQPETASDVEQTHFGRCFVEMIERIQAARGPFLLWCHLAGLGTTWDAPLSFREAYQEQGDPPPPDSADVPDRLLTPDADPDELLGITQAYAGQVTLLDTCLGAFRDFLDSLPGGEETLLVLCSARGFPLGEHGRIGACGDDLFGEVLQTPSMIRWPDGAGAAVRNSALVQPADLWATLLDWWAIGDRPHSATAAGLHRLTQWPTELQRDRVCAAGASGRAIRTPAWFLREGDEPQLYAKPDDRWEVNNVVSLCPEVVERLREALSRFEAILPDGAAADLPPLDEVLIHGLG